MSGSATRGQAVCTATGKVPLTRSDARRLARKRVPGRKMPPGYYMDAFHCAACGAWHLGTRVRTVTVSRRWRERV